jgi:hypothetical protein
MFSIHLDAEFSALVDACPTKFTSGSARAIAFELLWQPNVSDFRRNSIEASFVSGHGFSRAARCFQNEVGLYRLRKNSLPPVSSRALYQGMTSVVPIKPIESDGLQPLLHLFFETSPAVGPFSAAC